MIYFIKAEKFVKIGLTSRKVETRVADMQTGNAHQIEILLTLPGNKSFETFLHKLLKEHHFRGEWFHFKKELEVFITDLAEVKRQAVQVAKGSDPQTVVNHEQNLLGFISQKEETTYKGEIRKDVDAYINFMWNARFTAEPLQHGDMPIFFRITKEDTDLYEYIKSRATSRTPSSIVQSTLRRYIKAQASKKSNAGSRGNPSELF